MQSAVVQAKSLNKAAYFFSSTEAEEEGEEVKLIHLNFVPKEMISKEFNARVWSTVVIEVVGGKVRFHHFSIRLFPWTKC